MRRCLTLAALLLLSACSEPAVDGSSEAALKASVEKISAKLDPEKRARFQESIQFVALNEVSISSILSGDQTADSLAGDMYSALDGKTADQVISEAERIRHARAARERAQALEEIAELEQAAEEAEAARDELQKFAVIRSRFYQREREYSYRKEPIIEIEVMNGTQYPVSRAYFKGTIASPSRSIPWLVEDFNYSISGGLEPGETAKWSLAPNSFGAWGSVNPPAEAVFTVDVVRLDGVDGEKVLDASGLSDRQKERLRKLKEQYQ